MGNNHTGLEESFNEVIVVIYHNNLIYVLIYHNHLIYVLIMSYTQCFFLKICLVPGNFHANLSPKLKLHISVNDGFYPKITYPTLNLRINQLD